MSLDVYLTRPGVQNLGDREAIFIREDGATKEISAEEFERRFPGREPVTVTLPSDDEDVYSRNITHNLGKMAREVSVSAPPFETLADVLWCAEEIGVKRAGELIRPLEDGLVVLERDRDRLCAFNPENGWGNYDGLLAFVRDYLAACRSYPDAEVRVSR